jgi:GDPmannose 4,6-dehydratase
VRDVEVSRLNGCALDPQVELVSWDAGKEGAIDELLSRVGPSLVFNLAALASGSRMYERPVEIGNVNGLAVARLLEAIRKIDPKIKICQASSREIFGEPSESPQTEITSVKPRSPYGAAKAYADNMVRIYREHHGLFACSAILFNHESPRRTTDFVSKKITSTAVRIKFGLASTLRLGNLDARRDWGFAGDYVRAMWLMLQRPEPDDFVIATGEVTSVREFCELTFAHLGLNYRDHVIEDDLLYRPTERIDLRGSYAHAAALLGWKPTVSLRELVAMMVDADIEELTRK